MDFGFGGGSWRRVLGVGDRDWGAWRRGLGSSPRLGRGSRGRGLCSSDSERHSRRSSLHTGGPAGSPSGPWTARIWRKACPASPPLCGLDGLGSGDMEPSLATGGSETTRLVSARDRSSAGGGLRLKSLFTEPSEPLPEEPKLEGMAFHHCHKDPVPQSGLSPERVQARRQLYAACAVCFIFMAGEVVGGYLAHSLAIMTDAAHLLADIGSMLASLFSLWLSTRPATRTMTFGWHRSETLGALASVVSLWIVTGILLYLAFLRLLHSDYHIEAGAMLLTASIAVCANLLMAFVLHQTGAPHSHGSTGAEYAPLEEGHGYPMSLGNTSVRAAFVHVLGDLLQSFGVLAASILIYFKPQYKVADPISTFLFSICALGSTAPTLRDVLLVLMEGAPRSVEFEPVRDTLLSVPGVRATHDLHLWALTLTYHVASAHLAIDIKAIYPVGVQQRGGCVVDRGARPDQEASWSIFHSSLVLPPKGAEKEKALICSIAISLPIIPSPFAYLEVPSSRFACLSPKCWNQRTRFLCVALAVLNLLCRLGWP